MFQSVYDYSYLSSSANHIFDITFGANNDAITDSATQYSKKRNIYNQMAQVLMGYDATGSIQKFDDNGDLYDATAKMDEVFVIPFSRLLVKDEIKKETFSIKLGMDEAYSTSGYTDYVTLSDLGAANEYRVNSPTGDYGILYATASTNILDTGLTDQIETIGTNQYWRAGLIFYQAGIAVLTGSVFSSLTTIAPEIDSAGNDYATMRTGNTIEELGDGLRNRIMNIQFNNTTELNSTVYFCRVNHNEFNYSSNPTYLESSRIKVKTQATDEPVSFITTIGLYNDNNELLATAKLSEPLKKSPSNEFTIRARLDY
jgi:hypothetical protein